MCTYCTKKQDMANMDIGGLPPLSLLETTPLPQSYPVLDTTEFPFYEQQTTEFDPSIHFIRVDPDAPDYPNDVGRANPYGMPRNYAQLEEEDNEHRALMGSDPSPEGRFGVINVLPQNRVYFQTLDPNGNIIPFPQDVQMKANNATCSPFPFCGKGGCDGTGLSFFVAFEILLLILIVSANVAIISVIRDINKSAKNRHNKTSNVFKLSLAIADLLFGLSVLPAAIQQSLSVLIDKNFDAHRAQLDTFNTFPSIIFGSLSVLATISGIWSILMIQIDLFLRIRWPVEQHSGALMKTRGARISTVVLWCVGVGVVGALWPLGFGFALSPATLIYSPINRTAENYNIIVYVIIVWGLPFLFSLPLGSYLIYAIAKACQRLRRRSQASYIKRHTDTSNMRSRMQKDWEAACRVLVVEFVYVVTFLPIILSNIFYPQHDPCDPTSNMFHFIATFFLSIGSFLNIFVYHMMWKDFQIRLRSLFCGKQANQGANSLNSLSTSSSNHKFHESIASRNSRNISTMGVSTISSTAMAHGVTTKTVSATPSPVSRDSHCSTKHQNSPASSSSATVVKFNLPPEKSEEKV
jgi:hypothetical protein